MTRDPFSPHLGLVVEGAGDVVAAPLLLRKFLSGKGLHADVLGKPVPLHGRHKATPTGGIEGYVATAAARPGARGILVVLDAEDDVACELGPSLLSRAQSVALGKPVVVCLAERTFEDWIYASAETLEIEGLEYKDGRRGLGQIVQALKPGKYAKPTWQPRLTARMDLSLAATRQASLDRLLSRFDELRTSVGL